MLILLYSTVKPVYNFPALHINRLKKIKGRLDKITVESLSNEELIEMETLASKISDFNHNRSSYKSELNQCMQEIFNGLNFMENYSKCKIAYRADDEMVVLRFPNSSYDEGQIGSQSNYILHSRQLPNELNINC